MVTGVARHSLGEAFVRSYTSHTPAAQVIGVDHVTNPDLNDSPAFRRILIDLNPLHFPARISDFAHEFTGKLAETVGAMGSGGVDCLVQCAGVYDFGTFLEHNVNRRTDLLGLNVLGIIEVLHSVMTLNQGLQIRNEHELTHVIIGSFQGLYARPGRSIYASSKAYTIDLCTSLFDGRGGCQVHVYRGWADRHPYAASQPLGVKSPRIGTFL